jgi:hypothetical protein
VRRDFPCPGDGGRRIPQRNAYWPILAVAALLLAAVLALFFATAAGR